LPNYSCDPKSLDRIFNSDSNFEFDPIPLDGILFYHKRVHYLPGVTPLVGWLKGYMLPEMLNVQVIYLLILIRFDLFVVIVALKMDRA
jgi:snurportin-1